MIYEFSQLQILSSNSARAVHLNKKMFSKIRQSQIFLIVEYFSMHLFFYTTFHTI